MITENYKSRIQELAGLLTENNSNKLMKFGMEKKIADFIVRIDDKLALFIATITLKEFAKEHGLDSQNIKEIISIINQHEYLHYLEANLNKLNFIVEWIKSPFREGDINLKEISDLTEAFDLAEAWHSSIEETGIIDDETGKILKTYSKDGFYWIDLQKNNCTDEANAMGHCGTDAKATSLISLRDTKKSPHVTLGYNSKEKSITQVKGRKNKKPIPQYMKYVYDFLIDLVKAGKLEKFEWSYGIDLDKNEIEYIFQGNLDVYIKSVIEKNLKSSTYIPIPFKKDEIVNAVGGEEYSLYIEKLLEKNLRDPFFNFFLKKGDIINAVGEELYFQYVKKLLGAAKLNTNYKLNMSKKEIIKVVGVEEYDSYIKTLINNVLENPIDNKLEMSKDETFALLGQDGYKNFTHNLIKQTVSNPRISNIAGINYVLKKHDIELKQEQIKEIVGNKIWFFFLKRENQHSRSNLN